MRELIRDHKNLRQEVGGISHSVGYRLEDESYRALPGLLKKDMEIEIIGRLKRDIDDFIKKAEGLKEYIPEEQVRVLVTYHTSPQVLKYARQENIKIYFSYEF